MIRFSPLPGARERQLKRRWNNPLFPENLREVIQMDINRAQREDQREVEAFNKAFRQLLQEVSELEGKAESEQILLLKEQADKLYEQASGLAGDFGEERQALQKLVQAMMKAVRAGAANDPKALYELDQEDLARQAHYEMLGFHLICDLLRPDSPISREELVPTLLSERPDAVEAAAGFFEPPMLAELIEEAEALLGKLRAAGEDTAQAEVRLNALRRQAGVTESH